MQPKSDNRPVRLPVPFVRLLGLALVSVALTAAACGDSGDDGGEGEYRGVCRSCDGDTPIGPNESQEACDAFGALFNCASVELSGSCANPDIADKATCDVDDCTSQPRCSAQID